MIIKPNLLDHWKFKVLEDGFGRETALVALVKLWGYCEEQKQWAFEFSPRKLAAICGVTTNQESAFWSHMTDPEVGWLTATGKHGILEVSGWFRMNRSLVTAWFGRKRPDWPGALGLTLDLTDGLGTVDRPETWDPRTVDRPPTAPRPAINERSEDDKPPIDRRSMEEGGTMDRPHAVHRSKRKRKGNREDEEEREKEGGALPLAVRPNENHQPTVRGAGSSSVGGSALAYDPGSGVTMEDLTNWVSNQKYGGQPMTHSNNANRQMELFNLAQRFWNEMEASNWRLESVPVSDPIAVFATRCYSQGLLRRTG